MIHGTSDARVRRRWSRHRRRTARGKILIQCKNYVHPVGPSSVRDLCGVMASRKADRGILVCTSTVTEAAERFAKQNGIELVDGREVIETIKKHGLATPHA